MTTSQTDQYEPEQEFSSSDAPFPSLANTQENSNWNPPVEVAASTRELEDVQNMQALSVAMEGLRRDFETKVKYDASKEQVIESLHRELQFHREGLHFRILRPLFTDLIMLHDEMAKLHESIGSSLVYVSDQIVPVAQYLKMFQDTVEETLRRNGAEPFISEGEVFLPNRQRSLKIIPTSDPALDKHIAQRVRQGFIYEDKLLRHELVEVYKFVPNS